MRFQAVHKLVSYLLAAAAVTLVTTSGAVPLPTLGLIVLVGVLSWFVEPGTRMGSLLDRAGLVFNVGALSFFALSLFEVVRSFPQPDLTPVLNLVLFLLGYKLFHRRGNRDYLQLYILSFLLVLGAAWLAQSVLFVVGFSAYVVLATWTLILFHLRREIEDNYLVKHRRDADSEKVTAARVLNSRRVVGGAFFAVTALVAVGVLAGSGLVFAFVPRIGLGFLSGGVRHHATLIGFSTEVTLGHHGVLSSDNDTVVLRARVPRIAALPDDAARGRAISSLYWRGTVYDTYQNGRWLTAVEKREKTILSKDYLHPQDDGSTVWYVESPQAPRDPLPTRGPRPRIPLSQTDEQEITVVGLSSPVAFALDQPIAFRMPQARLSSWRQLGLEPRASGEVGLVVRSARPDGQAMGDTHDFSGAQYFAYSRDPLFHPDLHGGIPLGDMEAGALDNYLRVPLSLSGRLGELATSVAKGKPTALGKVRAIVDWLRSTHGYTTNLQRNERIADPLEDFIFTQTAGHCEYFASAAAVMLRLVGVPTRYVNGFLGGEWNEFGEHITVRDNRAHSWVEAYLGALGWVRVDATPAAPIPTRMGRLRQIFDSVDQFWGRWVIDYDANRQLELARKLGRQMGLQSKAAGHPPISWPSKKVVALLAVALAAAVAAWALARRRWQPRRAAAGGARQRGEPPIARLYHRALGRLAGKGWFRATTETPREFASRLGKAAVPGAELLARLTEHYEASRYGDRVIDAAVVEDLGRDLSSLGVGRPPAAAPAPPA